MRGPAQSTVLAAVSLLAFCVISGRGRNEELVEFRHVVVREGVTADVAVPIGEPRSIATYRVAITLADGGSQRLEAEREGSSVHDLFEVAEGRLLRSFPTYVPGDPNAAPSGDTLSFSHSFADDSWIEIECGGGQK